MKLHEATKQIRIHETVFGYAGFLRESGKLLDDAATGHFTLSKEQRYEIQRKALARSIRKLRRDG